MIENITHMLQHKSLAAERNPGELLRYRVNLPIVDVELQTNVAE